MVFIGLLINVVLACRFDSDIFFKLKDVFIMGGNIEVKGNIYVSVEFNFYFDVEVVYVVLN